MARVHSLVVSAFFACLALAGVSAVPTASLASPTDDGVASVTLASTSDAVQAAVKAEPITVDQPTHGPIKVEFKTKPAGPEVQIIVLDKPKSLSGGMGAGSFAPAKTWKNVVSGTLGHGEVSNYVYTDNEHRRFGANKLATVDIYPKYGDVPGELLAQSGKDNFVSMEFPVTKKAKEVVLYETFNPGGITKVVLVDTAQGEHQILPAANGAKIAQTTAKSGSVRTTISFAETAYDVQYVRLHVDASEKWRGIDAIQLEGFVEVFIDMPGTLPGGLSTVTFLPDSSKIGCDTFRYQAAVPGANQKSSPAPVTVCYGCPKHPRNGKNCGGAGRGRCKQGKCLCHPNFGGDACEKSSCPTVGGQMCNNKGNCNAGVCQCFPKWTGKACTLPLHTKTCTTYNDPHHKTFDGARFSPYESGEYVEYIWRDRPGPIEVVNSYFRQCGSRAYREHWSPIGCNHGGALRLGDNIVSMRGGEAEINCQRVAANNKWVSVGNDGLRVKFTGVTMDAQTPNTRLHVDNGAFVLTTEIPTTEPNSNRIVGMCGNNDGVRANDVSGARDWADVPRFPTDKYVGGGNKRARAIKWNSFFKPKPGCELKKCGKCDDIVDYSAFPLKYNGQIVMASEQSEISAKADDGHVSVTTEPDHVMLGKYVAFLEAQGEKVSALAAATGPADMDVSKLPKQILDCPLAVLQGSMDVNTCLLHLGDGTFSTCVVDSCLHASKEGGMSVQAALAEAAKENDVAHADDLQAEAERHKMRHELHAAEVKDEEKLREAHVM